MSTSPEIKLLLGFSTDTDDKIVKKWWERRRKSICKPCWELKYCPYGPLVEEFPLVPLTKDEAIEHDEFLRENLRRSVYDEEKQKMFKEEIDNFNPNDYPEQVSQEELHMGCQVFGHLCPVFFVNEPLTETMGLRRIGRHISTTMKIRIVRRDNYTCQVCGKHLKDDELEFDHLIPISKGGSSEEHNIRLACYNCNRRKSNRVDF